MSIFNIFRKRKKEDKSIMPDKDKDKVKDQEQQEVAERPCT